MSTTISLADAAKQAAQRRTQAQEEERKRREEQRQVEEAERREQMTAPMVEHLNKILDAEWTWGVLAYDPQGRWAVLQEITDPRIRLMVWYDASSGYLSAYTAKEVATRLGTPWERGREINSLADLGDWLLDQERDARREESEVAADG